MNTRNKNILRCDGNFTPRVSVLKESSTRRWMLSSCSEWLRKNVDSLWYWRVPVLPCNTHPRFVREATGPSTGPSITSRLTINLILSCPMRIFGLSSLIGWILASFRYGHLSYTSSVSRAWDGRFRSSTVLAWHALLSLSPTPFSWKLTIVDSISWVLFVSVQVRVNR